MVKEKFTGVSKFLGIDPCGWAVGRPHVYKFPALLLSARPRPIVAQRALISTWVLKGGGSKTPGYVQCIQLVQKLV